MSTTPKLEWGHTRRNMRIALDCGMDLSLITGIVMLVAWAVLTLTTEAPGFVHLLLTAGVFLIIWRIVVRGTPSGPDAK